MNARTSFDDNGLWSKLEFSSDSLEQWTAQNLENSLELQKYGIQVLVLSKFIQLLQGEHSAPWSVASFDQHARGYWRAGHCKIPWWRHAPVHNLTAAETCATVRLWAQLRWWVIKILSPCPHPFCLACLFTGTSNAYLADWKEMSKEWAEYSGNDPLQLGYFLTSSSLLSSR